jgi:hypothetical protein
MTYYLIVIQALADGSKPCAIYSYDSKDAVLSAYHSNLASCYVNDTLEFFNITIIDEQSNLIMHEHKYKEHIYSDGE